VPHLSISGLLLSRNKNNQLNFHFQALKRFGLFFDVLSLRGQIINKNREKNASLYYRRCIKFGWKDIFLLDDNL